MARKLNILGMKNILIEIDTYSRNTATIVVIRIQREAGVKFRSHSRIEVDTTADIQAIENLLKEIGNGTPDIHGLAVVSSEGLPIASELLEEAEMERVAAMTAAMLAVGKRSADELRRGVFEQVFIKGELGAVIIIEIGEEAVLTAVTGTKPRLGLVFMNMRRAAGQIKELL